MSDATPGSAAASALQATPAADAPPASGQPASDAGKHPSIEWTKDWEPGDAGLVEKKGWKTPQDLFKSYTNLEKRLGNIDNTVVLPKGPDDVEGINQLYTKLGRPEKPDAYKFPDGSDEGVTKTIAPAFHEAGLNQQQADKLTTAWNKMAADMQEQAAAKARADGDTAMQKLESEWGRNTPREVEFNRRAMRLLGIDMPAAENAMATIGAEKFMRLLNAYGHSTQEDSAGSLAGEGEGFAMSPNRARAEIANLKEDKAFWARYQKGEKTARGKMDQLYKIASGDA